MTHDHNLHDSEDYDDRDEWQDDIDPEFTDELTAALHLDWAELLYDAEAAIRWLAGDLTASQVEEATGIEVTAEEGAEIFKVALESNAGEFPAPAVILRAIAHAFEIGSDL
jgi:hypothetical protein